MNFHGVLHIPRPEKKAVQSGYPVETLQLCSAALRYVLIAIGAKRRTCGSDPPGICKALTTTYFFPPSPITSIAAKRSIMQWSGLDFVQLDWPCMNTEQVAFVTGPPAVILRIPLSGTSQICVESKNKIEN